MFLKYIVIHFFIAFSLTIAVVESIPVDQSGEGKQRYVVVLRSTPIPDSPSTAAESLQPRSLDDVYKAHISWISEIHSPVGVSTESVGLNASAPEVIVREYAIGDNYRAYAGMFDSKFVEGVLSKRSEVDHVSLDSEVSVATSNDEFYGAHENYYKIERVFDGSDGPSYDEESEDVCVLKFGARIQYEPPWNLDRIDQRNLPLDGKYMSSVSGGRRVNVFVIDTGININHPDFQGRASWGATVIKGSPDIDEYGLSLTGKYFPAANAAVKALTEIGVHVTVAAGNYFGANSCYFSPASTPEAITVGATNVDDDIAKFSNRGLCVDIFAPGQNVTSTWLRNEVKMMSGTSMASPHVAGVIALIISSRSNMNPEQMKAAIKDMSTLGALKNLNYESPNSLLHLDNLW
ncbi:3712_t:CDS:2 [Acaulospora colombiana]|uniref:3712_t:CDS:1 n=1 Tax=Acaulospora colombiana TaxID=27376 RepID=A0ACA9JVH1_9GLOM|nr:3712_t:CDS:2 [Acaulospora colombiana]